MIVQSKQVLRRLISSIGYDLRCIKQRAFADAPGR